MTNYNEIRFLLIENYMQSNSISAFSLLKFGSVGLVLNCSNNSDDACGVYIATEGLASLYPLFGLFNQRAFEP